MPPARAGQDSAVRGNPDWDIVYRIITEHLEDFRDFAKQIMKLIDH